MSNFFYEQFSWAVSNFFADVSSKIFALAYPISSQPDIEREMVLPPAGAYITLFTIYHVLPDLPGTFRRGRKSYACMHTPKRLFLLSNFCVRCW